MLSVLGWNMFPLMTHFNNIKSASFFDPMSEQTKRDILLQLRNYINELSTIPPFWETVKIFVHHAPSRYNLRKAVWLATVETAIGAMTSLSLVILGSLSVPMWVSLTLVGTTRLG
jgi:hypothetical protein